MNGDTEIAFRHRFVPEKKGVGTSLCQFFCSMAQLCATCFESVRVRFDFKISFFRCYFFKKVNHFSVRFYFFLVVLQPKTRASLWRQMAFLKASTWRPLALFRAITQTPGSAWASTESDSSFPLCSFLSFFMIHDFCACPVAPAGNPKRRDSFEKKRCV